MMTEESSNNNTFSWYNTYLELEKNTTDTIAEYKLCKKKSISGKEMETDTTVCFSDNWWWIAKEAQKPTLQFPPIFVPAVTKKHR